MLLLGSFFRASLLACTWTVLGVATPQGSVKWEDVPSHSWKFPSLINATIEDVALGLDTRLFTSVDLVTAYLARIQEVNETLHAVTQLNPDAMAIARDLDQERRRGRLRGPLHGIPVLIKNNIATDDKMDNTAGSYALAGARVPRDSTIASKLRSAGAIILGKANLSEWAFFRSFNNSNGWSAIGGQVQGAYYPNQDPSGSSSGSGVAASLGLATVTLGSETDGSIIAPAGQNNVVGIKPTVGLVARDLVIPISEHQDTVGPITRTVRDAAYLLQTIVGRSKYDNYTSAIPFSEEQFPDYVAACRRDSLRGKRIGVPRNIFDVPENSTYQPEIAAFNSALDLLRSAGATIVDGTNFPGYDLDLASNASITVLGADFTTDLASYFDGLSRNPQSVYNLEDLLQYTTVKDAGREEYPFRGVDVWTDALALGFNNTDPRFWQAYQENLRNAGPLGITGALKNYSLDALIAPTNFASHFPALLGSPVISVPLGFLPNTTVVEKDSLGVVVSRAPGIPFGISFFAERFSEEKLIGLAYAYEQKSRVRAKGRQPYIVPRTEVKLRHGSSV